MTRVTVIGAGFGALTAIRKLCAADASLHIDVIAPKPEFVYFPGTGIIAMLSQIKDWLTWHQRRRPSLNRWSPFLFEC